MYGGVECLKKLLHAPFMMTRVQMLKCIPYPQDRSLYLQSTVAHRTVMSTWYRNVYTVMLLHHLSFSPTYLM